ncbi:MAG: hypothetical protein M3O30_15540 [Planctomycetota bacterium]|nr:hypothetical protein [Planctomycetota bacterium]
MDEKWEKIAALDLTTARQKFAVRKSLFWWLTKNPHRVESEYRQFLYLIAANPGKTVVPWSRDLDDFWHAHILDTAKYAQDCQALTGSFIHHNPHLPEGSPLHRVAFSDTREMYRAAFGESAKKGRKRTTADIGCSTHMPVVFCAGSTSSSAHSSHHDSSGGHHGGGHGHGCAGHGGGHGGGHGCGGGGHGGH